MEDDNDERGLRGGDIAAVVLYFVLVLGIGLWVRKTNHVFLNFILIHHTNLYNLFH